MKILIIMGGFLPGRKFGGPPVSVDNFCTLLCKDNECFILTHNHDLGEKMPYPDVHDGWNDRGNCYVKYVCDSDYNYSTFKATINEIKPDFLYLQGLFQECVLPCLKIAKEESIRVLLAPRGELCQGAFRKKYKKIPYIVFLKISGMLKNCWFQSTSQEETEAIRHIMGVSEDKILFLENIPSLPKKVYQHPAKKEGTANIVFVSRVVPKKNLDFAINCLRNCNGDVKYTVFGPLQDKEYWKQCQQKINDLPYNVKVQHKGILSHEDINRELSKYDAFLFPTKSENFGHVIVEAMLAGCLPIISDQTPWNDINEYEVGWALPLEKEELYNAAINEIIQYSEEDIENKRKQLRHYLEKRLKIDELREKYENAINMIK